MPSSLAAPSDEVAAEAERRLNAITPLVGQVSEMLCDMQFGDLKVDTKSNHMDLVTIADRQSEERLVGLVRREFPDDAIVAEEGGSHGDLMAADFCWAIDPVDGTINYAHGLPLFAISIGLLYRGVPCAGLISHPALGKTYRGLVGGGASCNGKPIRVSSEQQLSRALVVTGFPYDRAERMEQLLNGVRSILTEARGLRRTGSAAVDLCWVADGRFGAMYELNLSPWDSVGGAALIFAAGGHVSGLGEDPYDPFGKVVLASNRTLHAQLIQMLAGGL